jgi:homoserine kinase
VGSFVSSSITVEVPATTANIGPGFDCLGAALSLHNKFRFTLLAESNEPVVMHVKGTTIAKVGSGSENLLYKSFSCVFQEIGKPCSPVEIELEVNVPLARGLGSSATAIVGGLVGANTLLGLPLSQTEVMQLAIAIEGHPDNVVPALLGGCRLAATGIGNAWEICDIPWHSSIAPVVAIPDFELSTAAARQVLPDTYSRADAIFNAAHLGLLLRGLATGNPDWLRAALQDRIHQPYRRSLIPDYEAVEAAAIAAGAYGLVISGAGPTLLALAPTSAATTVATAMGATWQENGITAEVKSLHIDTIGAKTTQ